MQGMQSIKPSSLGSFLSSDDLPAVPIVSSPISGGEQIIWLFLFLFCFVLFCVSVFDVANIEALLLTPRSSSPACY